MFDHEPHSIDLHHTATAALGEAALVTIFNPLLGGLGWLALVFGLATRAAAASAGVPVAAVVGLPPFGSFLVGTLCPLVGAACLVVNVAINWRNSEARIQARIAKAKAEHFREWEKIRDRDGNPNP